MQKYFNDVGDVKKVSTSARVNDLRAYIFIQKIKLEINNFFSSFHPTAKKRCERESEKFFMRRTAG